MDTIKTISSCCLLGQVVKAPLFVRLACKCTFVCWFFLSDSRIASHSPFACKWQNRFWDNELVIARFLSKKGRTSNIKKSYATLQSCTPPLVCMMCVVCVGLAHAAHQKKHVLSLILLIPLVKLTNQKRGIYRHRILYPLQLEPPFPNDVRTLRPKASLEPNQKSN